MNLSRRLLPIHLYARTASTKAKLKTKFNFELSADVSDSLKNGSVKARHHAGKMGVGVVHLPEALSQAAFNSLKDFPEKSLMADAHRLSSYIWSRHPPPEKDEYYHKIREVEHAVKEQEMVDPLSPDIGEELQGKLLESRKSKVIKKMKNNIYHWKPIEYNGYRAAMYVAGRLAPDYASLYRILAETKKRDPHFSPLTLLDFGSGVGTSMWVVDSIWPGKCKEVVCIDSSSEMNDMADKLLRGGDPEKPLQTRPGGTFFKQFLPMSSTLKYDIVVSSRSLFELPDMASRLRTIDILWRKTSKYLVLVEAGTNAGYRLIQEARDYLLEVGHQSEEERDYLEGHVFSPCSHDKFCPRFFDGSNTPCNFEVSYKPFRFGKYSDTSKDLFTYVVLKKGKRNDVEGDNVSWPRIVRAPLCRTRHVICRTCTKYGTLQELTVTKRRHGKECYSVSKNSDWGDMLPVEFEDTSNSESDSHEPAHPENDLITYNTAG
ncbi:LOW QUALITY PROTEIN: methyltransferase-like protein 17, mitochondrial [Penaeus chinensis]|uniref:LOW QUALITY PROTEIN: methyltransferase-like protein 17, mitochondrial n=1 Tax=Penaeus chinensis TaxID=139456 RepID=UPI001FB6B6CF|nr:LOW QUALITY PROTEIN: methyltransferase-like protein 17, mitochondrial [Penaeus chinensis]